MFKKFSKESVGSVHQLRSSAARAVKSKLVGAYGTYDGVIDDLMPKKDPLYQAKCHDHISLYICHNKTLFFEFGKENKIVPVLRTIHTYPNILPKFQVDEGAIKHVIRGANIMSPGLLSAGGAMDDVEAGTVVAITAEGKENALGIGETILSTEDIRKSEGGVVVNVLHVLGDGLWNYSPRV